MYAFPTRPAPLSGLVLACALIAGCSARTVGGAADDGGSTDDPSASTGNPTGSTTGPPDDPNDDGNEDGDDCWADDTGDEGFVFIPPSDHDGDVMCDLWADDCPDGEKCTAYATQGSAWDANKCVPVMGDGQHGEPCQAFESGVSGLDTCDKGAMCWDVDPDTLVGYCAAFCKNSPNDPQCPDASICGIYNNGVLPLCYPTCDPLAPTTDCPNPDNVCVSDPGGLGFMCARNASAGQAPFGSECQYVNSCNYGLFCANADAVPGCQGAQGCCSPFCDLNQPDCPPDLGLECVPWFEEAPPGYENVGGCVIPG